MEIKNKVVDNGTIVGYIVDDGSFTLPLCKKALFSEMYIPSLIDSGYKYYGYDADLIEDKDGNSVTDLPEVSLADVDELEWAASIDHADTSALSDADAAKYYSYRESSILTFRTEPVYEINTRERFIQYLETLERQLYDANFSTDNRPINSFVNPEALFTIDELRDSSDVRHYFDIMIKRHHFRNYGAYQNLIRWLKDKGVLNTEKPSLGEFLAAYYAWGPEGIKDKCTDYKMKVAVDGTFEFMSDPLSAADKDYYVNTNRVYKVAIIDGNDTVQYLKYKQSLGDLSDYTELGRSRLAIDSNDKLFSIRRRTHGQRKYMAIQGIGLSDVSDRLYFNLMTESGYAYTYKISHNKIKIGLTHTRTNEEIFSHSTNFAIASVAPTVPLYLDQIDNETDYFLHNLAIIKSAQLAKKKSKNAPYASTTEALISDGVNPVGTVELMSKSVTVNKGNKINHRYDLSTPGDDLTDAIELYLKEIPDYILKAYNLTNDDITEGMQTFLELADIDELKDRRDEMMAGRIGPGDNGFDPTFVDYSTKSGRERGMVAEARAMVGGKGKLYDAIDYYTKIKFASDCIHGNLSVDYFGDGILEDIGVNYGVAAQTMLSVVYAELGDTPDKATATQMLINMENSSLIDINRIFRDRDMAWKGFMVDFAQYRKKHADENVWIWAYCTKVFREISNAPVSEQRPYLMELVTIENNKHDYPVRELMTACVKEAIEAADFDTTPFSKDTDTIFADWNLKRVALSSAEYIAAKLFFFVYAGGVKTEPVDGNYVVKMAIQDGMDLQVKLPVAVYDFIKGFNIETHKKYMSVYDFCKYEYNPNTPQGTFNVYLVNADVDPWHVKPKTGYSIKSFPLLPNYYKEEDLDKANGEGFYLQATQSGGICVAPLKRIESISFVPTATDDEYIMNSNIVKAATTYEDLASYLDPDEYEYIFAYIKRWSLAKKLAAAQGKVLYSIPLKQDIVYGEFAYTYCDEPPVQEIVFKDAYEIDETAFRKDTTVTKYSWRDYVQGVSLIAEKGIKIHPFSINDIDFNNIDKVEPIISSDYRCPIHMAVSGNYLVIKEEDIIRVPVSRISKDQLQQFVQDGVLCQISENKYFVRAVNGDYIMEVMS